MVTRRTALIVFLAAMSLCIGGAALAQSSNSFSLRWFSLDNGGGQRSSANYLIQDSLGGMVGEVSHSNSAKLISGFVEAVLPTTATPETGSDDRDPYEEDDRCEEAAVIGSDGAVQHHTFHEQGDEDWLRFVTSAATTYRIEVEVDNASTADVTLEAFRNCGSTGSEPARPTFSPGIRQDIESSDAGEMWLRLTNCDGCPAGKNAAYRVSVRNLTAAAGREGDAAIILAGRLRQNDSVQKNIHFVTDEVRGLFVAAGYTDDQIMYMAHDAALPGYDRPATRANLEDAILNWAKNRVQTDGMLTLYLMDHGDKDVFYIDEVNDQRLTPADLHGWLTTLESSRTDNLRINVVIEACNSGSFIDPADGSISKAGRVVITSTSERDLAFASAQGAHFSDHFVGALRQGRHFLSGFAEAEIAVDNVAALQEPWIDDNGDGLPNANDGVLASQRSLIYNSNLRETQMLHPPSIFDARLTPSSSEDHWTISADVRDDNAVTEAWAVVYAPSYRPPDNSRELAPETYDNRTLFKVDLNSVGNDLFSETFEFTEDGRYRVVIHASDDDGLGARPALLTHERGNLIYLPIIQR